MERRSILTSIGASLLGQLPFARTAPGEPSSAAPPSPTPSSSPEYEPFRKIAKAKGVQIFVDQPAPAKTATVSALHLDMNMVRASIENAIARTKQKPVLNQRLQRLLSTGSAVQQVEFVHGSGRYYFPEDVEKAIAQSQGASAASDAQCWVCENVCTLVCTCLGNGDQYCKDRCREVCHKYC